MKEIHLLDYRYHIDVEAFNQELHGLGAIDIYVDKNVATGTKNKGMS